MTNEQRAFLSILAQHNTSVGRKHLTLADRKEDRVRQSCRREGWVLYGRRQSDKVNGWRITDKGRAALTETRSGSEG